MRLILFAALALALLTPTAAALVPDDVEEAVMGTLRDTSDTSDAALCGVAHYSAPNGFAPCPEVVTFEAEGSTYYVSTAEPGLHRESNGCVGFQQEPSDCDGDGAVDDADDYLTLGELSPDAGT